jgi:HAD superfamily hydrolase (TIGR01509 family)
MPARGAPAGLDFVFFDIGGVMYDDTVYARSWMRALRELGATFTDEEFDEEYSAARAAQSGSFRKRLTERFLGRDIDMAEVEVVAAKYWTYPAGALYADVRGCLEALSGRYHLGIIANQPTSVRSAMERDGLVGYFEVWGVSDDLGLQKPDPALFTQVLETADVEPGRAAMVGDRLDYDIRPAKGSGMLAVWVLRGEAPDEPTPEQLSEADASVTSLEDLPAILEAFGPPSR